MEKYENPQMEVVLMPSGSVVATSGYDHESGIVPLGDGQF